MSGSVGNGERNETPIRGLYSPSLRKVGCVLLTAAFQADRRVNVIFDAQDWFVSPVDDMRMITAPLWQWEVIAAMPPNERPGPEAFSAPPVQEGVS